MKITQLIDSMHCIDPDQLDYLAQDFLSLQKEAMFGCSCARLNEFFWSRQVFILFPKLSNIYIALFAGHLVLTC